MTRAAGMENPTFHRPVGHNAVGSYRSQLDSNMAFIFAVLKTGSGLRTRYSNS